MICVEPQEIDTKLNLNKVDKVACDTFGFIAVIALCDDTEVSPWSTRLPQMFMGWRVIMYICPTGYIGAFLDVKEVKDEVSNW